MKKTPIVSGLPSCISPDRLGRVQFRRINRQEPEFDPVRMPLAERYDPRLFVKPGIIQNQKDLLRIISQNQASQKGSKGMAITDIGKSINEVPIRNLNSPKDMLGLLLSQTQNMRLMAYPGPSLKQRRFQPKRRLILKHKSSSFFLEFFLMPGMSGEPIFVATAHPPGPTFWWDAERRTPDGGESS